MELDGVRKELNYYDDMIKNMLNLRMALIPIVADIKIKNNMPFFQGKREEEIYKNIEIFAEKNGIDSNLVKEIYQLIIANAIKLEESISEDSTKSIMNHKIDLSKLRNCKKEFEKLDRLIEEEVPQIILKIKKECEAQNLNLNQIATLYYHDKIDNENI